MSKAIKLEDQVYDDLDQLRGKGETFSDIVSELLHGRSKLFELIMVMEGQLKYREWQQERLRQLQDSREEG